MSQARALQLLKDGIAAAKVGNRGLTRQLLREVTELDPTNEVAWLWLAGVAESPQETVEYLEQVLEINPANERARAAINPARLQAGIAAAQAKNLTLARRLLTEVTEQDPNHEMGWLWLAGVAETSQAAVTGLERVLQINPKNERALAGLNWYRAQMAPPAAGWECPLCQGTAVRRMDKCPVCKAILVITDISLLLNNSQADGKRLKAAVDRLEEKAKESSDFQTHFYLGVSYLNLKQLDKALPSLEAALRLRPHDRVLGTRVAQLREKKAKDEAALMEKAAQEASKQRNILVVDDSPTVRKLVMLTIERQGHRVTSAGDGYEAVDRIREEVPDLILLDISMPGMDGYQLCKLVRETRATAHVPVVMLSGKDGFFNKIRGKLAGSTEYITKPFQPEVLLGVVNKYCQNKNGHKMAIAGKK